MHSSPIRNAAWPFLVLGVPPAASHAQVREAYRMKMRSLHPDKLGRPVMPSDTEALRDVREAEEMLRTPLLIVQRFGLVQKAAEEAKRLSSAVDAPCRACSGMGSVRRFHGDRDLPCPTCGGTGWEKRRS